APGRSSATRTTRFDELGHLLERRTYAGELHVLRQYYRKLVLRHRKGAALVAIDDRDGRAPVALARDTPVAQPVVHAATAPAGLLEAFGDCVERLAVIHAVVFAGVHQYSVIGERAPGDIDGGAVRRPHDLDDRQA